MAPVRALHDIRCRCYHVLTARVTARAGALIYARRGRRIRGTCGASTMQIPRSHPEAESQEAALESPPELAPKVTTRVKITKAGNSKLEFG